MMISDPCALSPFLRRLLLRSQLSEEEQAAILHLPFQVVPFAARQDIVLQGARVDFACLVSEGLVARFDQLWDGHRQITALHVPGDFSDLYSTVAPTAGWGITALSNATVLQVPHDELRRLVVEYPNIAMAFWRDTTADASVLAKWIANVGRKDARARTAHLFCEMGLRMEAAGLGTRHRYRLLLTQEQFGDTLGLTGIHVNRTLQGLRTSGAMSMCKPVVEIHDWDALAEMAEFDPLYLLLDRETL